MARIARIVIPDLPHHIIQRGNRNQTVFFSDSDKATYKEILFEQIKKHGISIWAYCLMDNHVHLISVPEEINSLSKGVGETNRRYTRMINFRKGWKGYLWQGRFVSYPLDKKYLYAAVKYIENNPVNSGLVKNAEDYPWSSAQAHVYKTKDPLLSDNFLTKEIKNWENYLQNETREKSEKEDISLLIKHAKTGRPLGDKNFLTKLENFTKRNLIKQKPGPKNNN